MDAWASLEGPLSRLWWLLFPVGTEVANSILSCVRKYADSDALIRDLEELNAGEPKPRLQMLQA